MIQRRETTVTKSAESTRDLIIHAPDWEAAKQFYRSVLGLTVSYENDSLVGFETGAFQPATPMAWSSICERALKRAA